MKLTITNKEITTFWDILEKIQIHNMRANRGRAKLLSRLREKFVEYEKDREDILKDSVVLDAAGQLMVDEAGNYVLKEGVEAQLINSLLVELADEPVVIKGGEHSKRYMDFLDCLSEAEDAFSAEEILLIDKILDQYEESKGEENDE